jgi:hypothetical protein
MDNYFTFRCKEHSSRQKFFELKIRFIGDKPVQCMTFNNGTKEQILNQHLNEYVHHGQLQYEFQTPNFFGYKWTTCSLEIYQKDGKITCYVFVPHEYHYGFGTGFSETVPIKAITCKNVRLETYQCLLQPNYRSYSTGKYEVYSEEYLSKRPHLQVKIYICDGEAIVNSCDGHDVVNNRYNNGTHNWPAYVYINVDFTNGHVHKITINTNYHSYGHDEASYIYDVSTMVDSLRKDKDSFLSHIPKDIVDITQQYL